MWQAAKADENTDCYLRDYIIKVCSVILSNESPKKAVKYLPLTMYYHTLPLVSIPIPTWKPSIAQK